MKPFYFWTANYVKRPGACQYYRISILLNYLRESGLAHCYEAMGENMDNDLQAMYSSDVCHFYSLMDRGVLDAINSIRPMKVAEKDGNLQYPPITIYDSDDNSDYVHPINTSFVTSGTRSYPNGELLKPDSILHIEDGNNNKLVSWIDKETYYGGLIFDIERNLTSMKTRHMTVRAVDGATVTSPKLADYFKNVLHQPNVHVFPNTVVLNDYAHYDVIRENPDEVRVLWQGGMSHYIDWYPLRDALKTVSEKYTNIKWIIWGEYFNWIHDVIPEDRVEWIKWTPNDGYKIRRGLLNIDINLCPLANNVFNWCKSAVKWYEGSIWKNPEATLAANVGPYKEEIVDGISGLLYNTEDEFVEKFSILVNNIELRKTLGANAKKWILKNRVPEATMPPLLEFYKELKEQQRARLTPRVILVKR